MYSPHLLWPLTGQQTSPDPSGDTCTAGYHPLTHVYAPRDLVNDD